MKGKPTKAMKPRHQSLQKLYKSVWTLVPKEYYIDGLVSLIYVYKNDLQEFKKKRKMIYNIYKR